MWKMERALNDKATGQKKGENFVHEQNNQSHHPAMKSPLDIAIIGSAPFEQHMKNKNMEVFVTSLYEIDQTIEDKRLEE